MIVAAVFYQNILLVVITEYFLYIRKQQFSFTKQNILAKMFWIYFFTVNILFFSPQNIAFLVKIFMKTIKIFSCWDKIWEQSKSLCLWFKRWTNSEKYIKPFKTRQIKVSIKQDSVLRHNIKMIDINYFGRTLSVK